MRFPIFAVISMISALYGMSALADPVVAVVTGDWNRDGARDAAMILEPGSDEGDNSLKIYLSEGPGSRLQLKVHADNFVYGSSVMAGQTPGLQELANGSLAVKSQNASIGRNRWSKRLTIAWRDRRFVVAGFTFDEFDTLGEPDADGEVKMQECDLNLIEGKGEIRGERRSFAPVVKTVTEWDDEIGHTICNQ